MAEVTLKATDFTIDHDGNLRIKAEHADELVQFVKQVKQGAAGKPDLSEPHFMVKVAI